MMSGAVKMKAAKASAKAPQVQQPHWTTTTGGADRVAINLPPDPYVMVESMTMTPVTNEVAYGWRQDSPPPPVKTALDLADAGDFSEELMMFYVRDCTYADDSWSPRVQGVSEEGDVDQNRVIVLVGWIVSRSEAWTRIASVRDDSNDHFGGGMWVPSAAIIETVRIGEME